MLESTAVMMQAEPGRGLYESFYFRGTSLDGQHAFWLKHNMLRYRGSDEVWLDTALILFDRARNRTAGVSSRRPIDGERFARMASQGRDWDSVDVGMPDGTDIKVGRAILGGQLSGEGGQAHWDLLIRRSGMELRQYPHEAMYRLPWPATKLMTRDCHVDFHGSVWAGDLAFSGDFHGMNGHNWGAGHAHTYAYASCAQFEGRPDAYFDGLSARVPLAGGRLLTPFLSLASFHDGSQWHHFNRLRSAARHAVRELGDYRWRAEFSNSTHRLEVEADGGTPASVPWVALNYDNPDRSLSLVKSTKFANLRLQLAARDGSAPQEFASDVCELETRLVSNPGSPRSFFATP